MTFKLPSEFFETFFDDLLDGVAYCQMIFDSKGKPVDCTFLRVNKSFVSVTGLKKVVGKNLSVIVPELNKTNPELVELFDRVYLSTKPDCTETHVKSLKKWFSVCMYCLKGSFFLVTFQDITSRKKIELDLIHARIAARNVFEDLQKETEALALQNAKDEAMLESIGDGIIVVNKAYEIIVINKMAANLLQLDEKKVLGKTLTKLFAMENAEHVRLTDDKRPIKQVLETGKKISSNVYYFVRKNETSFPVSLTVAPLLQNGKILGAVGVFRDITKEREIDAAKTEFVSLASHQLRTPLTAIGWFTEMLLNGKAGVMSKKQKEYLDAVYLGNKRMVHLVNTLLDVSRLELGTYVFETKPTNITKLIHALILEQKLLIKKKKITLVLNLQTMPRLKTDPNLLSMILQNILSNALKYTPDGGKVHLTMKQNKKRHVLQIQLTDTGYGIPLKQQDKIFTKLFRADNIRTKALEGTGLGLYIVKTAVDHAGGKVRFVSKENKGTTFFVELPLVFKKKENGKITKRLIH